MDMNNIRLSRQCIVCRKKFEKSLLIRIVKNNDGRIFFDKTGKSNGRGAYICRDCITAFQNDTKKNPLSRSFRQNISRDTISEILEELTEITKSE